MAGGRLRPRLALIYSAVLAGAVTACSDAGGEPVTVTGDPTRADVIEAVRLGVAGKTYTETAYGEVPRSRTCSQIDVDLDPYMPGNPELATCSYVGDTYTVWDSVTSQEVRSCPAPPDADDSGWYVESLADDQWRVSHGTSRWMVSKLAGGAVGVEGAVTVSSYQFGVQADRVC